MDSCVKIFVLPKKTERNITMDISNHNTKSSKNKHLTINERAVIQYLLSIGKSPYYIARELDKAPNTIRNEIQRGSVEQIKHGKKVLIYFADVGQANYEKHRLNSCRCYKRLECSEFIGFVNSKVKDKGWSLDACFGWAKENNLFERSKMVCTKTLYNYTDHGLMEFKNIDLPQKLHRNTKPHKIHSNKKKLGRSIESRPDNVDNRTEFGHWEIDTVIGRKSGIDSVLLTLAERQTRNFIVRKIANKTSEAVMAEIKKLYEEFGSCFSKVFKTITGDNGSEFAELSTLEDKTDTKVYFTHPFSSFEKGTNERHNGLIRRFIPKGRSISDYSIDDIFMIEQWCNTLPRRILNYKTPETLFEKQLDLIYATA